MGSVGAYGVSLSVRSGIASVRPRATGFGGFLDDGGVSAFPGGTRRGRGVAVQDAAWRGESVAGGSPFWGAFWLKLFVVASGAGRDPPRASPPAVFAGGGCACAGCACKTLYTN